MEYINQMFWRVLFIERRVDFNKKAFCDLHHVIFPCVDSFEQFLNATTTEKMVATAKEISSNILFSTSVSPTPAVYRGLIDAEANYPTTKEGEFISQDHVVHSVNVYLLGVYLFFNHQLLHDRVFDFFKKDLCEFSDRIEPQAILQFIDAWKIFAFCHDIGYPFEKLTDKYGYVRPQAVEMLEFYREFGIEVELDTIIRSIASLMFATVICNRSKRSLRSLLEKCKVDWAGLAWTGPQLEDFNISNFPTDIWDDYYRLYCVNSEEDLTCLYPFITKDKIITVIRNKNETIVGFRIFTLQGITTLATNTCGLPDNFDDYSEQQYIYEYYCKSPQTTLQESCFQYRISRYFGDENWLNIATFFAEPEISILTNNKVDCRNTIHSIYSKLRKDIVIQRNDGQIDPAIRDTNQSPKMVNVILDQLKALSDSIKENDEEYQIAYERVCEAIDHKLKTDEFYEKAVRKIVQTVNPVLNRDSIVLEFISKAFNVSRRNAPADTLPQLFSAPQTTDNYQCMCKPLVFEGNQSSSFEKTYNELIAGFEQYLTDLGIIPANETIAFFTDYTNDITCYDHGIIGTHILLFSVAMQNHLKNIWGYEVWCESHSAQSTAPNPKDSILEGLGAILVHNIYTNVYAKKKGISYKLTMDEHPLAYFGALCDALQIWDRHYSIDQSRCILKNFNPSRSHLSIEIHGKKIVITCETENYKKSGEHQRNALDEYLKSAASLLKVNLLEEPI